MAELQQKLQEMRDMRTRIINGYEPTDEEIRDMVHNLRLVREDAATKRSTSKSKKAPAAPVDLDALFGTGEK